MISRRNESGERLADLLRHSWRLCTPSLTISEAEISSMMPLILGNGAAGLVWHRLKDSKLSELESLSELRSAFLLFTLLEVRREQELVEVVSALRGNGVEPVVVKGWSAARLYPERGLRPYGDIDICVAPEKLSEAKRVLSQEGLSKIPVDLHSGFRDLDDRPYDETLRRTELATLGNIEVRVLGMEDHLRLLSLHFIRHGGAWPPSLCDVALSLETIDDNFDWGHFLRGDSRRTEWAAFVIQLAEELLGADVSHVPDSVFRKAPPKWLRSCVLEQWSSPYFFPYDLPQFAQQIRQSLRPQNMLAALRLRWPNPIMATEELKAPINNFPRFPLQAWAACKMAFGYSFKRIPLLATRI